MRLCRLWASGMKRCSAIRSAAVLCGNAILLGTAEDRFRCLVDLLDMRYDLRAVISLTRRTADAYS